MKQLASPSTILRQHALRAKHSWGQNFLGDEEILTRIVEALSPAVGEPVLELGAGLGHLTAALLQAGAWLTAVERDRDLVRLLEEWHHPRLRVVAANAATLEFSKVAEVPHVAVVGNLPFHLTTPQMGGRPCVFEWSACPEEHALRTLRACHPTLCPH